jgi:hypothetical protein
VLKREREREKVREDNCERRDHIKPGKIVGDCWTTFEFGVIHGVGISLRFDSKLLSTTMGLEESGL